MAVFHLSSQYVKWVNRVDGLAPPFILVRFFHFVLSLSLSLFIPKGLSLLINLSGPFHFDRLHPRVRDD
jgi:hypothetical protein